MATLRRLHPVRVLLASRDPRFLGVTGFLLERSGFAVTTTRKLNGLLELVESRRANVVVVDGSDAVTAATRVAARIKARRPGVGVVLVDEDSEVRGSGNSRLLPKWAPFETLASEIEHACMKAGIAATHGAPVPVEGRQLQAR